MTQSLLPAESTPAEADALAADEKWRQLSWLPCDITLDLPVARFTVRDLLQLRGGSLVETSCGLGAEIPLRVNEQLIGWVEFEPLAEHLAVRITELI